VSVVATLERFAASMPQTATADISVNRARVLGSNAWIAYRRDDPQHEYRTRYRVPPILELDVLNTLMSLPVGLPVPLQAMSRVDRVRLRRAPVGAVTWSTTAVTRQVRPPLTPVLAIVRNSDWMTGLRSASRFAAYCQRLLIVPELPNDTDAALAQASYYGIGVAVGRRSKIEVLLAPEELSDWQPTPAWWWFCEEVYRAVAADARLTQWVSLNLFSQVLRVLAGEAVFLAFVSPSQ
jgi:hypothetical protein